MVSHRDDDESGDAMKDLRSTNNLPGRLAQTRRDERPGWAPAALAGAVITPAPKKGSIV
jgi:hypothetical protein